MARKDLGKLVALANQGDEAQPAPEPAVKPEPDRPSVEATTAPAAAPRKKTERADELAPKRATRTAKAKPAAPAAAEPEDEQPLYLTLERKDTRLREDQIILLTQTARKLNRKKGRGGQRITENTLIRVAIDVLLEHSDPLAGATEQELTSAAKQAIAADKGK